MVASTSIAQDHYRPRSSRSTPTIPTADTSTTHITPSNTTAASTSDTEDDSASAMNGLYHASTSDLSFSQAVLTASTLQVREVVGSPAAEPMHDQPSDMFNSHERGTSKTDMNGTSTLDEAVHPSNQTLRVSNSSTERGQAHLHETRDLPQRPNRVIPPQYKYHPDGLTQSTSEQATVDSPTIPNTPRKPTFIKVGAVMPASNNAKQQLWESGGESNTTALVGSASRASSFIRKHLRTTSGGTAVDASRHSSSSASASREEQPSTGNLEVSEHPEISPSREHQEQEQLPLASIQPRSSPPPVRHTPWTAQDRPRSGSTIRFQPQTPEPGRGDSRRATYNNRHITSSPQLSPLMPLLFQPDLPLEMLSYTNRSARIIHTLYPLFYYLHVPFTLFLDFNVLYALAQVASHHSPEGVDAAPSGGIAGTPRVNPWWIALAFYALSTLVWFIIVFLLHDIYYCYYKVWKNRNPPITDVYLSAPTFHLSCIRSYDVFCALWRLRLSSFTGIGSIPPSRRQGILETSQLFMQNWPTIITLMPRAFISLSLLVSFTSSSGPTVPDVFFDRDSAYFRPDGTLSTYSIVFNLINVTWAIGRCLLALVAGLTYLYLSQSSRNKRVSVRPDTPGDSYTVVSASWPSEMPPSEHSEERKRNLRERVIELVLLCSSSSRWRTSKTDGEAYKRSRSARNARGKDRRKRRSTVTFQTDQADLPEMEERPPSNLSFNVHLPARSASVPISEGIEVDEAGRELRVSSIPTRRKNKVSIDSTASSIFTPMGTAESSQSTMTAAVERPFSALGYHSSIGDQGYRYMIHARTRSGASCEGPPVVQELDEEELERLAWERHPPLTPRGSLVQAREELALQQKERSYWSAGSPTEPSAQYIPYEEEEEEEDLDMPEVNPIERDLHAIVEESEEEMPLRRANSLSNRQTVSSRQSSLRRAPTPLNRLEDAGISIIEERSEHGQTGSTS